MRLTMWKRGVRDDLFLYIVISVCIVSGTDEDESQMIQEDTYEIWNESFRT